jgi:prolyl oligopeptidase
LIHDPYRWLEDPADPDTAAWSAAQDELFAEHVARWPQRPSWRDRLAELHDTVEVHPPQWYGDRGFFLRRQAGQEHAVVVALETDGTERVLVDPMVLDPTGATTLDVWWPSIEGDRLAYLVSRGGTEMSRLWVIDVASGATVDGPIDRLRYSPVAWLPGGEAFYYVRHVPAGPGVTDAVLRRRVYLHRIGTDDDVLIFGDQRPPGTYFRVRVSRDGRWVTLTANRGTDPRNDAWIADLSASAPERPAWREIQMGVDARVDPIVRDGRLYLWTDRDASRARLCVTSPDTPGYSHWRDLVPERPDAVLRGYVILDGPELGRPLVMADWLRHAVSELTVHDGTSGALMSTVELPGLGTVPYLSGRPVDNCEVWFSYTDFATPATVYRYDARTGAVDRWAPAPAVAPAPLRVRQVRFASADGIRVRMFLIMPEAAVTGPRPTVLYGYGGFNHALTPVYTPDIVAWVRAGGVFAVANLRGGSEEGEAWHRAGMLGQKQNVFDDFAAAARWLVDNDVTTPAQLGLFGVSNGGLLVGAALTQWPERCAAVVCSAPLLDMVRYELSGLGSTWVGEYGTATDPEQLGWLLAYSPYHNVTPDVDYPAVLFTVFESDTRVDPLHGRKLTAALQNATTGTRPILLRREVGVGHGPRSTTRRVELLADQYAFLAHHLGLRLPGDSG